MNKQAKPSKAIAPSFERDILFSLALMATCSPFAWVMAFGGFKHVIDAGPAGMVKSAMDGADFFYPQKKS